MTAQEIRTELKVPQADMNVTLNGAFHVTINKNYTASVRSLRSFMEYIEQNPDQIDETFGNIVREPAREELNSNNFYYYLVKIIGLVKGFATFNSNPHQFVQLSNAKETVSIRTKDGKLITVAVLEGAGCADISLHNSGLEPMSNGSRPVPVFELTGLDCGGTPVPKAKMTIGVLHLGTPISSQKPN
jgi:hypothetical protein